jgi:flagellar basal body-associated protein FliL
MGTIMSAIAENTSLSSISWSSEEAHQDTSDDSKKNLICIFLYVGLAVIITCAILGLGVYFISRCTIKRQERKYQQRREELNREQVIEKC